jgi:cell division protein FtsZ
MAIGTGRGATRALDAARAAMASPLLDVPIEGATRVLLNITGGTDVTLMEVQQAADFVSKLVDPEANIIFGMVTDAKMEDEVRVTVIATGVESGDEELQESIEEALGVDPVLEEPEGSDVQGEPRKETSGFLRRLGFGRRKQNP